MICAIEAPFDITRSTVIAGYPEPRGLPTDMPIERVFLASGVLLLVLPNDWQGEAIGNKILITWNASREARRAQPPTPWPFLSRRRP
jgi:hypothetical protein